MPILFFDTETTGLLNDRLPLDHPAQPQIVQLACLLADDAGEEMGHASFLVQPIRGPIPAGAAAVHGITTEKASANGLYPTAALYLWDRLAQMADVIVAHNMRFDWTMMQSAWAHNNPAHRTAVSGFEERHGSRARFCTMEAAAPIVNLPPTDRMRAAGFDKPKPPKLEECIRHFFGKELDGAHDALVDVRACAQVFFHLKTLEAA